MHVQRLGAIAPLIVILLVVTACNGTRSISNSGYPGTADDLGAAGRDMLYRGEIDDVDLLIPAADEATSDAEIAAALADRRPVTAELGKPLLVVQSGALAPDAEMIAALNERFAVVPFSGRPPRDRDATARPGDRWNPGPQAGEAAPYARRLRLAAAEGGCSRILVYWGVLETQSSNQPTRAVSWVPVIGWMVPDQTQDMRIRLKAAIIDTASGRWRMLTPDPIADDSWSNRMNRAGADQDQVARLKAAGYQALAKLIADQARQVAGL